tara:strand:+ start:75 stop:389 length:315 start_codon:yes stop_codon:yes gene_type:complete
MKKNKIKVRIVPADDKNKTSLRKKQTQLEENYSQSQLETLNQFHNELDALRAQLKKLKAIRQKLLVDIKKLQSKKEPIKTIDLFNYCSALNKVSKGKFPNTSKK